jgi:hypothetical protein
MIPVLPFAFTAALGAIVGATVLRLWLDLLRHGDGGEREPAEDAVHPEKQAKGPLDAEWLIYCPACRVYLAALTATRCREPECGYPTEKRQHSAAAGTHR